MKKQIQVFLRQTQILHDGICNTKALTKISLSNKGSIVAQVQAHTMATWLGHGNPKSKQDIIANTSMAPIQPKQLQVGVLRRKHQRGQNRVRLKKIP